MKKLNKGEPLPELFGNPVLRAVRELEVGESLVFGKDEWKPTSLPTRVISAALNGRSHVCRLLADKKGWCVTRKK